MKIHESGSLWNGDKYNICSEYGYFTLEVNDAFYCSGDSISEIYDELKQLEQDGRASRLKQFN